jgi:hypothetical protein
VNLRGGIAVLVALVTLFSAVPSIGATAQSSVSCSDFGAWVWAQTVYQQHEDEHRDSLDPDGVGCEIN